jgi:hypothetical protein
VPQNCTNIHWLVDLKPCIIGFRKIKRSRKKPATDDDGEEDEAEDEEDDEDDEEEDEDAEEEVCPPGCDQVNLRPCANPLT